MKAIALRFDAPEEHVRRHLVALASRIESRPVPVWDVLTGAATGTPVLLTVDDRGGRTCRRIAELLEAFGWRGHFFVTPGFIGAPGFLTADEIRALARRGHVIGIHGSLAAGAEEWDHGARILSDILRVPVCLGSASDGSYARSVVAAAASVGVQVLFTSDPAATPHRVDGCLVLGRYTIDRTTAPRTAAAWAAGSILPRLRSQLARALGVAV